MTLVGVPCSQSVRHHRTRLGQYFIGVNQRLSNILENGNNIVPNMIEVSSPKRNKISSDLIYDPSPILQPEMPDTVGC